VFNFLKAGDHTLRLAGDGGDDARGIDVGAFATSSSHQPARPVRRAAFSSFGPFNARPVDQSSISVI